MAEEKDIPIVLELVTVIRDGARRETSTVNTKGTLTEKGTATYIRYDEEIAEVGNVRNVVKIGQAEASIMRHGAVSMRQRFQEGETTEGSYQSPVGPMKMETKTKRLAYRWNEENRNGSFRLHYELNLQDRHVGLFELTMKLKEAPQ